MDTTDPRTAEIAARDAALGGVVQSALDQLASTITQRDDVAQATLKRVQDQLRAAVRTADKQRQQQLESVADNIMAAIETRQQISESMLSPIVQQLADTGVQVPTAGTGGFIGPPTVVSNGSSAPAPAPTVQPPAPTVQPPFPGQVFAYVGAVYCDPKTDGQPHLLALQDTGNAIAGLPNVVKLPWSGWYPDDATAQAALLARFPNWLHYPGVQPCGPGGGGGTGGGGCGGPGQAPCLADHWWVVCSADGDARVTHSPTPPPNQVSGPWASKIDGDNWILDHPEACGKQPPPPPPPPDVCPAPSPCAPAPVQGKPPSSIPCAIDVKEVIGSEGFCETLDLVIGQTKEFGQALFQHIGLTENVTVSLTESELNALMPTLSAIPVIGPALSIVYGQALSGGVFPILELFRTTFNVGVCLARSVTCGDPIITMSLNILRTLVHAFKNIRIGANAGLWATLDIEIKWDQAEALLDYLIKYSCPWGLPGVGEADEAFRKHLITEGQWRCWLLMNNTDPDVHKPVFMAGFSRPGPGERKSWVYRLRPDVVNPNQTYTDVDFALDLQRDGTDPAYTRYMQDTLYRVFQLRELRQLLDANVASKEDILSALLSEGFSPEQAPILRDMEWVLTERKREAEIQGYTPSRIAHLYSRGEMNDTEALDRMQGIGYTREQTVRLLEASRRELAADQHRKYAVQAENDIVNQTKRGYLMGTVHPQTVADNLSQLGILPPTMQATLKAWDLQHQLDQQQESIRGVKSRFETGEINNLQATEMLDVIGMSPVYALQTVGAWAAGITQSDKIRRGEAVLSMLSRSAVSPDIAMVMLSNLGWETDVAEAQIASAVQRLQQTLVRAEQGREQGAKRAALAAEKLALEGNDATLLARSVLKQITPLSSVKKWFEESLVSEEWARTRMAALGIPPDVIDLEIRDSQIKMEKKPPSLKRVKPVKPPPAPKGLTLAALKAWLKDGQISVAAFTTQLLADGYDPGIIDLYVTEICDGKTASCVAESGPQDSDLPTGGGVPPNGS